ncbi:MAG: sensor histidine kinase, partial [Bacillota bacterium]
QINPHFLFNALNTITATCRINPEQSRELLMKLASIFRKTLKRDARETTLEKEIEFCRDYLGIEKVRLGDRLKVDWDLPEKPHDYVIPPFVIQPLVENSIRHGIQPLEGEGRIKIKVKEIENKLKIIVSDNGVGISDDRLNELFTAKSDRIGLKNIKERIENLYDEQAELDIKSQENEGTEVNITLPIISEIKGELIG